MIEWVLVICLNASGASCETRQFYPMADKKECNAARMQTGLPLPDKNYAPRYKGQDTAWCMHVKELEG